MFTACIRCGQAPSVDEDGYCGHCHWAVRAEIEEGMYALKQYLARQAEFAEFLRAKEAA